MFTLLYFTLLYGVLVVCSSPLLKPRVCSWINTT